MKNTVPRSAALDGFLRLAASLSANSKLDLIAELSASLKKGTDQMRPAPSFGQAFGAFESSSSAEEIIEELRVSRSFTRQIEPF